MPQLDKALPHRLSAEREGFLPIFEALPLGLAPMAGFSTAPFRTLAARLGASFTITELVSARGIRHDPGLKRSARYLQPTGGDKPWGIQLFGQDPGDFAFAIDRVLSEPLYRPVSFIDINMGCPAPKVLKEGAGCALMRDRQQVERIIRAAVRTAGREGCPVTAKIRSGISPDAVNAVEIARAIEQGGAAAVTVHARTLDQYYRGRADWEVIGRVKQALSIPVFGNGDIRQPGDLEKMRSETACDGFMVGRAARGNPFIFRALRQGPSEVSTDQWLAVMIEHLDATVEALGETTAVKEMRSHFAFYLRGFERSPQFRRQVMVPARRDGVVAVLREAAKFRQASRLLY